MLRFLGCSLLVALLGGAPSKLCAALLIDSAALVAPKVIDFHQFPLTTTSGPVEIGTLVGESITWTATLNSVIGDNLAAFGNNGTWSGRNGYVATNGGAAPHSMTFRFNGQPVSAVGAFMNYCVGPFIGCGAGPMLIEALNSNGNVLESHDIWVEAPISTPNAVDSGAFRGISRASSEIVAFRVTGGPFFALDDFTFARPPVLPVAVPVGHVTLAILTALLFWVGLRFFRRPNPAFNRTPRKRAAG